MLYPVGFPVAQAVADLKDRDDAVHHRGGGADGDETVHIGRALEEGAKPYLIVLVIHVKDGEKEEKLEKGEDDGVARPMEHAGQGPAQHVAHGEIEQGD